MAENNNKNGNGEENGISDDIFDNNITTDRIHEEINTILHKFILYWKSD